MCGQRLFTDSGEFRSRQSVEHLPADIERLLDAARFMLVLRDKGVLESLAHGQVLSVDIGEFLFADHGRERPDLLDACIACV